MSLLALAVTGRGLIDPHEPAVRADDGSVREVRECEGCESAKVRR